MRILSVGLLVLVVFPEDVLAKPKKRRKVQGPEEPKTKYKRSSDDLAIKNWQEGRKEFLDECFEKKKGMFTIKGKLRERSFTELTDLMADELTTDGTGKLKDDSRFRKGGKVLAKAPTTTTTTTSLGTRGKKKLDLLAKMGGVVEEKIQSMPSNVETREKAQKDYMKQMSMQTVQNVIKRTKLPPDHRYTVKEFCDIMWRVQNPSPLDNIAEAEKGEDPWQAMSSEAEDWWDEREEESEVNIDDVEL